MSILPRSAARAQQRAARQPASPRPRGTTPRDAYNQLCTWNFQSGGWFDSQKNPHVIIHNPKRRREAAQREIVLAAVDSTEPPPTPPPPPPPPPLEHPNVKALTLFYCLTVKQNKHQDLKQTLTNSKDLKQTLANSRADQEDARFELASPPAVIA